MKNKTVKRRKNKAGSFTTINYSILRDKNLTSNAKILLIEMLSDADRFTFSETLFVKRMGISKSAYYRALKNLIENGYVRITKIGNSHYNHYTVCEYGNLGGSDLDGEPIQDFQSVEDSNNQADASELPKNQKKYQKPLDKEDNEKLLKHMESFGDFMTTEITEKLIEGIKGGLDFYEIRSEITKIYEKEQRKYFKTISTQFKETTALNDDTKKEALKILKNEVFDNNKMITYYKVRVRAGENVNRRRPIDPESEASDRISGQPEND